MKKVKLKWKKPILKATKSKIGAPISTEKKKEILKKLDKNGK